MPYSAFPDFRNRTPFSFEPVFLVDEEARPLLVTVLKATFSIRQGAPLALAAVQQPIHFTGQHWGDPGTTSYRYEPECAFMKPATDVAMVGHAVAPDTRTAEMLVGLKVGPVQKAVRVYGDRYWRGSLLGPASLEPPARFERIPLIYERAFGGWDRSRPGEDMFEARNPVGCGFRTSRLRSDERIAAPNIADAAKPIESLDDRPPPAGFGFICPHWQPRAKLAGRYDDAWLAARSPLLPTDFDRRFFNAASAGLVSPGYLRGDEDVALVGTSPQGRIDFKLPGLRSPRIEVHLRRSGSHALDPKLDTVLIDADAGEVMLTWRAHVAVREVPHDVLGLTVDCDGLDALPR